jgi:hypothetical protein
LGKVEKLELVQRQQHFSIAAGKEPQDVRPDPNTRMLMRAEFQQALP